MRLDILSLDLATRTGWARGRAGEIPLSGSIQLGEDGHGPGQLGQWLRAHRREHGLPDLIVVEKWLNPRMQKHYKPIEVGLRLNGCVHGIAGVYGVPVAELNVDTVRATVCGRKSADLGRAPKNKDEQRTATKEMVWVTMKLLKLLPEGAKKDYDRSDALCHWRYAEAVYGRAAPKDFVLTGS